MPVIDQRIVDSVFFLFRTEADALLGTEPQGTGFLVVHDEQLYGVSNHHVVHNAAAPVIRLNDSNEVKVFAFDCIDWHWDPLLGDIAAVPITNGLVSDIYRRAIYGHSMIKEKWSKYGVGDEVFMIGMFANHHGNRRNNPLARFGNISMMASKEFLIPHPTLKLNGAARLYEAHIVDMHSRSGYSGSPVFAFRPFGKRLTQEGKWELDLGEESLDLIGIHYAQFQEPFDLVDAKIVETESLVRLVGPGTTIQGNSGMTVVAPSWKILELLAAVPPGNTLTNRSTR